MKKTILIAFMASLLLLSSCSRKSTAFGIWSEEGVDVYSTGRGYVKIEIGKELLSEMADGEYEEMIQELFPGVVLFGLTPEEWERRSEIISSLMDVIDAESIEEAYRKEKKSIKDSKYLENMALLSKGFDKELLDLVRKKGTDFFLYRAEDVVGKERDGKRKMVFLKKWIKAIV